MNLFEVFIKIGADTSESDKAIKDTGAKTKELGEKVKSGLKTVAKVSAATMGTMAAGVAKVVKDATAAYADYEQLVGGVETLFKQSSDTVLQYADNAYKTAGLSANQYMDTVTSFSASLLQSLGGDTEKAAKQADKAITDMADNSAKFGTDIQSIQYAYQGFAKQNFTMLDNLKLGYGGTKEEMQRLLSDAEKLTGKKFDLSSYSDIVEAIHAVQTEMGITGTTAKEASMTIQGSVSSAKSAWQNLLVGIADDNQDFGKLVDNFVDSVATAAGNILPRVEQSLTGIVKLVDELAPVLIAKLPDVINTVLPGLLDAAANLVGSVIDALPALISGILPTLLSALSSVTEKLLESAVQAVLAIAQTLSDPASLNAMIESALDLVLALVHGLLDAIPQLIAAVPQLVGAITATIITELPNIIAAAVEIMVALIHGLMEALPQLMAYVPNLIIAITNGLLNNLGTLISGGVQLLLAVAQGMIQAIPDMVAMIPRIIASIVDTFRSYNWSSIGKNIVAGMRQGVANAWKNFREWFKNLFGDLTNIAKKILGIASPSKVFKKIGKFTTEGLAIGIEQGGKDAFSAIKDVSQGVIDNYGASVSAGFGVSVGTSAAKGVSLTLNIDTFNNYTQEDIKSLAERLSEMLANAAERKAGAYA